MLRRGVLLALGAIFAWAQPPFEVRGAVAEHETGKPVQAAEVMMRDGYGQIPPETPEVKIQWTTTDSQGAFRFDVPKSGQYSLLVHKAGYSRPGGIAIELSTEKRSQDVRFYLQRAGELSGVVIDDETNQPLANFDVGINAYYTNDGRVSANSGWLVQTNAEGRFRQQTFAGNYVAEVRSRGAEKGDWVITRFTDDDIRIIDFDYRSHFFPGGPAIETALPIPLAADELASLGTIRVRKEPLYRVFVNLDKASCPESATLSGLNSIVRFGQTEGTKIQPIPCGPFLLTRIDPGDYQIELSAGEGADQVDAVARYTVTEQNLEIPLRLSHGGTLRGTLKAGEGVDPSLLPKMKVKFAAVYSFLARADAEPHVVDGKGRFEYLNMQPRLRKIAIADLDPAYFIKEVRYRGLPVPGGVFYFTGEGELEIEIERGAASLTGTVLNRDKSVDSATFVLFDGRRYRKRIAKRFATAQRLKADLGSPASLRASTASLRSIPKTAPLRVSLLSGSASFPEPKSSRSRAACPRTSSSK